MKVTFTEKGKLQRVNRWINKDKNWKNCFDFVQDLGYEGVNKNSNVAEQLTH